MSIRMTLAVVIPCYNVERHIEQVIAALPAWVTFIVAVDDASQDGTAGVLDRLTTSTVGLRVLRHPSNQGVGGAMVTGYREALRLGADVIVKVDGDGQMDPAQLPRLLQPLLEGRAHYAKGNRFRHLRALQSMPWLRRYGNVALTFASRCVSGSWHVFDVQNGFVAVTREALESIPLDRVDRTYAFENSMLALLNVESWPVIDVPMPARYADEVSSMRLPHVALSFPARLLGMLVRRIVMKYLVYDVSPLFPFLILGSGLLGFGVIFGAIHWAESSRTGIAAATGTVVLSLLTFLMGFMLLLQALTLDMLGSPRPTNAARRVALDEVAEAFAQRRTTLGNT